MGDVTLLCPGCGKNIVVSEFVRAEAVLCKACGASVPVPRAALEAAKSTTVKPKLGTKLAASATPVQQAVETPAPPLKLPRSKRRRSRPHTAWERFGCWVAFAGLTALFYALRHRVPLSPEQVSWLLQGGIFGILFFHVVIVLHAFGDDAFQGVLCALIPGYSFYYLFTLADAFYLRALVAALLIVFGWDAARAAGRLASTVYRQTTNWINTAGLLSADRKMPK